MARKIKFPLEMKDGTMVRNLEELKQNFDIEKAITYFLDGKLLTWLEDRGYIEEADKMKNLSKDESFEINLCSIFDIEYEKKADVNLEEIESKNEKIAQVKEVTDDENILKKIDNVALNEEEFIKLIESDVSVIYLLGQEFKMPLHIKNKKIIGLNKPIINIDSKKFINFQDQEVFFENVRFNKEYAELIELESKRIEQENSHKKEKHEYETSLLTDFLLNNEERKSCEKYFNIIQEELYDFEFDIDTGSKLLLEHLENSKLYENFKIDLYGKSLKDKIQNANLNKVFYDYKNRIS